MLKEISFTIRIKRNFKIANHKGKLKSAYTFFKDLRIGETRNLGEKNVLGSPVYVVGEKTKKDEHLILITDKKPEEAFDRYSRRQEIETMFGCLKTRGFNFEDTHITKPERIDKLIAVMAITFAWIHRAGDIFKEVEPIKIKKHGFKEKVFFVMGTII